MSNIVKADNLVMDDLRKGDIITFLTGEKSEIMSIVYDVNEKTYYVQINETTAFRYNEKGKCEFPSYDISEVELVEQPEDNITYYIPDVRISTLPYIEILIKGAKKPIKQQIIKSIFDLNGMGPFYKGEIINATFGPVVIAELKKCKGRSVETLKTIEIFCKDEKEAKQKMEEFTNKYTEQAQEQANNEEGAEVKSSRS